MAFYGTDAGEVLLGVNYGDTTTVYAGDGNDTVLGTNRFFQQFYGGNGNDLLAGATFTTINGVPVPNGASFGDELHGDVGNDRLLGFDTGDLLDGGSDNDFIDGGTGPDRMLGGDGNDTFIVDDVADLVIEAGGGGFDTVRTSVSYVLPTASAVEVLIAQGAGAINLTGNIFRNLLTGNAAANVVNGGAGVDDLTGLGGPDTFVFNTALDRLANVDYIRDFSRGQGDKIELAAAIFKALPTGTLDPEAFRYGSGNFAPERDDRIIYNKVNGYLLYDADGSGSAHSPIKFAVLATAAGAHAYIKAADFLII